MNILHAVPKERITPEHFLAVIEIPSGSKNKYELDKQTGALILDRILYTSTHYPENYGFIPRTWGLDDDPVDVLVITSEPIVPLAMCRCKPIGLLLMTDTGKVDEKVIAVCENDPFWNSCNDVEDLPKHIVDEIVHFFTVYKELETGKSTKIDGIKGAAEAKKTIAEGRARYDEKFTDRW